MGLLRLEILVYTQVGDFRVQIMCCWLSKKMFCENAKLLNEVTFDRFITYSLPTRYFTTISPHISGSGQNLGKTTPPFKSCNSEMQFKLCRRAALPILNLSVTERNAENCIHTVKKALLETNGFTFVIVLQQP